MRRSATGKPNRSTIVGSGGRHRDADLYPGQKSRKKQEGRERRQAAHQKLRNRIEITFGRLKDWWCVATLYSQCTEVYFFASTAAVTAVS